MATAAKKAAVKQAVVRPFKNGDRVKYKKKTGEEARSFVVSVEQRVNGSWATLKDNAVKRVQALTRY